MSSCSGNRYQTRKVSEGSSQAWFGQGSIPLLTNGVLHLLYFVRTIYLSFYIGKEVG